VDCTIGEGMWGGCGLQDPNATLLRTRSAWAAYLEAGNIPAHTWHLGSASMLAHPAHKWYLGFCMWVGHYPAHM